MSSRSQIQFVSVEVRTSGKDVGTESNMIMQGLAGVTFSIMAALSLIKRHPPQRITTSIFMNHSLESWLGRFFGFFFFTLAVNNA